MSRTDENRQPAHLQFGLQLAPGRHLHVGPHLHAGPQAQGIALVSVVPFSAIESD